MVIMGSVAASTASKREMLLTRRDAIERDYWAQRDDLIREASDPATEPGCISQIAEEVEELARARDEALKQVESEIRAHELATAHNEQHRQGLAHLAAIENAYRIARGNPRRREHLIASDWAMRQRRLASAPVVAPSRSTPRARGAGRPAGRSTCALVQGRRATTAPPTPSRREAGLTPASGRS
jgi:hypothetical protein